MMSKHNAKISPGRSSGGGRPRTIAVVDLGDFACQPSARFGHEPFGLRSLAGARVYQRMVDRLRHCEKIDDIYLIGSNIPMHFVAGSIASVKTCLLPTSHLIQRLAHAVDAADAQWCVYLPANRPFVCANLIDQLLGEIGDADCDAISFRSDLGAEHELCLGVAGEVLHCDAIRRLRRHVSVLPSMDNQSVVNNLHNAPGAFHLKLVPLPPQLDRDNARFAICTESDWDDAHQMCGFLGKDRLGWSDLVDAKGLDAKGLDS